MKRPNILWISFEDCSPRLGCYGDPIAQTPNIDRLAAEGIRFDNAFAVAGVCAPSRCAIITGMYPTSIGSHHMRTTHTHPMAPDLPTPYETVPPPHVVLLPQILRSHGYYTCNNEKTDYQFAAPFTAWHDCSKTAHWRNRETGQPFFAVFNNIQTHESNMWPEKGPAVEIDPSRLTLPPHLPDTPACREALARHYQNIASNDAWAGKIIAELEEDGELENTIILFWSDHGEGLPRAKRWPYDAGIRVPLIARLPGCDRIRSTSSELVSLVDLAPTMLSLAGIELPPHLQGNVFLGPHKSERSHVFATRDRYDESYDRVRAVRDRRYKYIRNYYPNTPYVQWIPFCNRHPAMKELFRLHESSQLSPAQNRFLGNRPAEELYDTESDPHELDNIAPDPKHRKKVSELREALDLWESRFDRFGDIPESEMVASWWPQGVQPSAARVTAIPLTNSTIDKNLENPLATLSPDSYVQLYCSTQGASIGYRFDDGPWTLYCSPFMIVPNTHFLHCKAIRIGYSESPETIFFINTAYDIKKSGPIRAAQK